MKSAILSLLLLFSAAHADITLPEGGINSVKEAFEFLDAMKEDNPKAEPYTNLGKGVMLIMTKCETEGKRLFDLGYVQLEAAKTPEPLLEVLRETRAYVLKVKQILSKMKCTDCPSIREKCLTKMPNNCSRKECEPACESSSPSQS